MKKKNFRGDFSFQRVNKMTSNKIQRVPCFKLYISHFFVFKGKKVIFKVIFLKYIKLVTNTDKRQIDWNFNSYNS